MKITCGVALMLLSLAAEGAIKSNLPAKRDESWWQKRLDEKCEAARNGGAQYVFIGDSITHYFEEGQGRAVWMKYFGGKDAPYPALNLGFGGDRTEHVLYRIEQGVLDGYEAKCVVLLIGTNNSGQHPFSEEPPADTLIGIKACVDAIRARQPKAKIVLCSIFPRGATATDEVRRRNEVVNRELMHFADGKSVFVCDLTAALAHRDGRLPRSLFPDLLHPSAVGYEIWANAIIPYFNGLSSSTLSPALPDNAFPEDGSVTECPRSRLSTPWWIRRLTRNRNSISECGGEYDIVMLGDSITCYWEVGAGSDESHDIEILEKKYKILNCGYSADKIEHLLWRIKNGELEGYKAKLFTLMIGTNNARDKVEDIAAGVRNIIEEVLHRHPESKILLMGYLPIGEKVDDVNRRTLDMARPIIKTFAGGDSVVWFDISQKFLKPDGTIDKEMFDFEYIHPSTKGYRVWREALEPVLDKLLQGK